MLTLCVGASLVILALAAALHKGPIVTEEATLLSTVLGAAVGALATYLGLAKRDE